MAADTRSWKMHVPVRIGQRVGGVVGECVHEFAYLVCIDAQGLADQGHLVGERDIDVSIGVLDGLCHLCGEGVSGNDLGLGYLLIKLDAKPCALLVNSFYFMMMNRFI